MQDMNITITWNTAWQSKPLLLPRDVGKCRGCNTDRIVGTSWLLHSCRYFQEITATWRSCPYRELRTSGQNNNRFSTLTLSSRQSNSMDNRRTLEAGSLSRKRSSAFHRTRSQWRIPWTAQIQSQIATPFLHKSISGIRFQSTYVEVSQMVYNFLHVLQLKCSMHFNPIRHATWLANLIHLYSIALAVQSKEYYEALATTKFSQRCLWNS